MTKLKIEQHFFQKDSQDIKNSLTYAKGEKKKTQNKKIPNYKIKTELLKTSKNVVHSSTPKAVITFTWAALGLCLFI